ncbi:ABC transporter substrate-binding protein [Kineosporia succinea]|uniref:Peptide/nickel transport system substrate-binding protein n=1 Tax=Kineosporia succinea TaxID=84632 RepID=A0ABT9PA30_9ACTN|nr:ABC transporter substrate-binding protein [Kineosporia succinea]MDP9829533.1 peptide/nickel transport system substrate-binding protein [Kineosporia succinea]
MAPTLRTIGSGLTARRAVTAGLAVTALAALSACGGGSSSGDGASGTGGSLKVAIDADPVCLDPAQATLIASNVIGRQMVDSLIDQDPDTGEFTPWLAEKFESNDDATAFTFTLKKGVTFSDGTPLDAAAVKASLESVVDLGAKSVYGTSYLAGLKSIETPDDSTVEVDFKAPNAQFLMAASTPTLGIVSAKTVAASAEERCAGTNLVGSGPFTLDSYTANQNVKITKRTGYAWPSGLAQHSGDALLDDVTYQVATEPSVRAGSLRSKQVDMATTIQSQDEAMFDGNGFSLLTRINPGIVIGIAPNLSASGNPALKDEQVRKAIQLAIDRKGITESVLTPSYGVAKSLLGETTPGFTDESSLLTFDEAQANSILDAAGWVKGSDGIREKDGKKLSLTVAYFYQTNVVEYTQQLLRKVGVDLVLKEMTAAQYASEYLTGKYDFISTSVSRPDPDILRAMYSSEATNFTFTEASDPVQKELAPLFTEIGSTTDTDKRAAAAAEVQKILLENNWVYPMSQLTQVIGVSDAVQGVRYDAASRFVLYDASMTS